MTTPGTRVRRRRWPRRLALIAAIVPAVVLVGALTRCQTIEVAPGLALGTYDDEPYRVVLAQSVRDGLVDYAEVRQRSDDLDRYLDAIARFGPESTPALFPSEADRLAYYLNVYNAIMLHRWLKAGAGTGDDARRNVNVAWFFVDSWRVDGRWMSMDTLEQKVIRPTFDEPRIHFALVCGAVSCPPLLAEPFAGDRLDGQLDGLGKRWLLEPDGLTLDGDRVSMSKIFSWYGKDFKAWGGLAGVLERYLEPNDPRRERAIEAARARDIRFLGYDWTINTAG